MKRILVVDDEPAITRTLSLLLEAEGYEVRTATSGAEALQVAEAFSPEFLITDIMMPGMNGIELSAHVGITLPSCKVILFTGMVESVTDALQEVYTVLLKPLKPGELFRHLESLSAGTAQ